MRACSRTGGYSPRIVIIIAFVVTLLAAGLPAYATEGGGSHYPGGNEDFMAGTLPPPGMYPISYFMYYTANKLKDNNGNNVTAGPNPLDFKLDVYAYVFRFVHVTKMKLLGADVAWHALLPLVDQQVKIGAAGIDEKSTGLGDIEFSPFILGWHFSKNMHLVGTVDFMAPTGRYSATDPSSIGRNYWTIAPIVAATYISDGGFEVSGKFQYFFNTKNKDYQDPGSTIKTDYLSGNEFICDYLVGQHIGNWNIGVNGFIYKQVTDDEKNGIAVKDNLGQTISIGPAIQYNYKNMFFNLKYQWDTEVRNRPEGQKLWLKFLYAF
jgi:hypothetical protein